MFLYVSLYKNGINKRWILVQGICMVMFFLFYFVKVWTSIPNEGGQVYFLGPAATEHLEQAVLPDA